MTDAILLILCIVGFAWSGYHMAYASKCSHPYFNVATQRCTWCGKGLRAAFFDGCRNMKPSNGRDPFGRLFPYINRVVEFTPPRSYKEREVIADTAPQWAKELFQEMQRRQKGGWF